MEEAKLSMETSGNQFFRVLPYLRFPISIEILGALHRMVAVARRSQAMTADDIG
ncbi:MAG: hypothetical protein ACHQ9S_20610 [Candidatus Binatia bacterium]